MKFTPGQKVLVSGEHRDHMVPQMKAFIGKMVTISEKYGNNDNWPYRIEENLRWVWTEYMFVDAIDAADPNILFHLAKLNRII